VRSFFVGVRSLLGCGGAITVCDCLLGMWGWRSLFWDMGNAIAFWGCESAIVFENMGERSLFGVWECDRFWVCGNAIAVLLFII